MINIDHKNGTIYLSGGMEYAPPDDPLGGKWRLACAKELVNMDYVPLDITALDVSYQEKHGDIMGDIRFDTSRSELHRKAAVRQHFIISDIRLLEEDTDAVILLYDESARRGAGTISEAQMCFQYDIPLFVVSAWEDWQTEVPSWLHGLSTKVFTDFETLYHYLDNLPERILTKDLYGNRGAGNEYLCSLSGEVFTKKDDHFVSTIKPLYSKPAVDVVKETREKMYDRYQHFKDVLEET